MNNIHPTSIIHEGCQIDENVTIGAYSIIGPNVKIGKNSKIHSHVLIDGNTTIGFNNEIFSFSPTCRFSAALPPRRLFLLFKCSCAKLEPELRLSLRKTVMLFIFWSCHTCPDGFILNDGVCTQSIQLQTSRPDASEPSTWRALAECRHGTGPVRPPLLPH